MNVFSHFFAWGSISFCETTELVLKKKPKIQPYTRIPNYILFDDSLTPIERLVLFMIASFNPSFPSYEYLAKNGHCSRISVLRAIKVLIARGLLMREKRGRGYFYTVAWKDGGHQIIKPIGSNVTPIALLEAPHEGEETYSLSQEEGAKKVRDIVSGIRSMNG